MKLDYLQFQELEVFTRFGTHLEASMEKAIQRGRILREILKQERLQPLPPEFHMAWLVAFNDGLFDQRPLESVAALLDTLLPLLKDSSLTLDSTRGSWSAAVSRRLSPLLEVVA